MGETESARVDVGALLLVARRYDEVADSVDEVARTHLTRLRFDGAAAGREYAPRGDSLRQAVGEVVAQLQTWSRALREIASAIRVSAAHYADVEARAAARLA
ncbi:MAG: type VII secretion target [Mycobacterium sp.]